MTVRSPPDSYPTLDALLRAVRACTACAAQLPLGPRPVLQAGTGARILVVGQAPGLRVHTTGIPWDDPSGVRLRTWMGIGPETFHDPQRVAILPMGYCYPGRGRGGDLPPRRECAELWLDALLAKLPHIETTLLIGQYAQRHYLGRASCRCRTRPRATRRGSSAIRGSNATWCRRCASGSRPCSPGRIPEGFREIPPVQIRALVRSQQGAGRATLARQS